MGVSHLISIVGVGPGDLELLTVKVLKRIQEADVILYDALVGKELLDVAPPGTIKKYFGKLCSDGQNPKKKANRYSQPVFILGRTKQKDCAFEIGRCHDLQSGNGRDPVLQGT